MKRYILSVFALIFMLPNVLAVSFDNMSTYRIPSYETVEEYEYLVGQTVTFIPLANFYNVKMVNKFFYIRDFEILKIKKGRSQRNKNVKRMNWKIRDIRTNEKFDIAIYIGDHNALKKDYADLGWDDEVRIMDIPFYDMDKWQKDCSKLLGTTFTHPLVKAGYKVINFSFDNFDGQYEEILEVENNLNHIKYKYRKQTALEDCFREDLRKDYFTKLIKVEKPDNPEIQFGEIKTISDDLTRYSYEDNYLSLVILGLSDRFTFSLLNKSQYSLKLLWDDASFVDIDGSTSKVIHTGISFSEREMSQTATTIIRGASIEEDVIPTRNIYLSDIGKEWKVKSYYPSEPLAGSKHVQLMLPIQIKGVTNEYVFIFDITYDYVHPERLKIQ